MYTSSPGNEAIENTGVVTPLCRVWTGTHGDWGVAVVFIRNRKSILFFNLIWKKMQINW